MASSLKISILAMMAVVFFSSATTLTRAQDQSTSCASKLVPCQAYLSTTTQPPDSCCNSIKEAVANELPCLCKLYNDPNLFQSLGINVTQAVMLSQRCGVTTDLSRCGGIYFGFWVLIYFWTSGVQEIAIWFKTTLILSLINRKLKIVDINSRLSTYGHSDFLDILIFLD